MFCTPNQIYSRDQKKKGGVLGAQHLWEEERCIEMLGGETWKKTTWKIQVYMGC
jgi:hypothetical protein